MPLEPGKSQSAFSHNVATEEHAGKPQKQAVAIAYSEKERTGDEMEEGYAPIKGSVSSLAELNAANARYHGQLEGETTFENTGDAKSTDGSVSPKNVKPGDVVPGGFKGGSVTVTKVEPSPDGSCKISFSNGKTFSYSPQERLTILKRTQDEHLGFQKLENKLAHEKGVNNPAAVAAKIGMEKYGKAGMEAKAHGK